jgi:TrmH family RNA methyltransferase
VDVQDPGNLGAIVRVAEAAGATAVLAAGASADPFGWKALRGSMGSAFRLPLARRITLEAALDRARAGRCQIVASVLSGTPLHAVDLSGPTCLFVGSEGRGLPAAVTSAADVRLAIPMERPVESLNVAVAAAVILYEARRQRGAPPGSRR